MTSASLTCECRLQTGDERALHHRFLLMHLSLFSDYCLRVLMYAALRGETFQLDDVTAAYDISRNHLAKVVNYLSNAGYLETRRGRGGGILLAQKAEDIRVGKLLRQTESHTVLVECFKKETNTCCIDGSCRLKRLLATAMNAFYEKLDSETLADLVGPPHAAKMRQVLLKPKA